MTRGAMMKHVLMITVAVALFPSTLFAAELPDSLLKCAKEKDDVQRLACFDAWFAVESTKAVSKAPENEAGRQADRAGAPPTASPPSPNVDEFGMNEKVAGRDKPPEPDSITATVTQIERKTRGERVIHLDIGQAWAEQGTSRKVFLEVGDSVVIEKGMFESYKLSPAGSNRFMRVTRVK